MNLARLGDVESPDRVDEEAHPRIPTRAPQHAREGHMYFDKEAMVLKVYIGGEWVQIDAWRV